MQLSDNAGTIEIVGLLIGGLALFLFGLDLMATGLRAIAGARLQELLGTLTANRFRGVLAGAGVTALLNSSTITTVLLVGFVSAGLMTLEQSVPMIMGANIGSTLTAQIIAFRISVLIPFMLAIGFLLRAFARRELLREIGGILLGFGLLFLGIEIMGDATHPLRTYQPFIDAMRDMQNPLLGIGIGAIFTLIVQSSAATLGIVIALASQGLIPLEAGIAIILGANVGTCGTALLAGIGKPAEAVQVGIVHLIFNVLGVLFFALIIPQFADFVRFISPSAPELDGVARLAAETPRQAANAHTIFSVAGTLILIWFTKPIAWIARRIAPSKPAPQTAVPGTPRYLDEALLEIPALGIQRIQLELVRLGEQVLGLVRRSALVTVSGDHPTALAEQDEGIDHLSSAILSYIGLLSDAEHSEMEGQQLVDLSQIAVRLDGIKEAAAANLMSVSQDGGTRSAYLSRLRNTDTSRFAETVIDHLDRAIRLIGHPDAETAAAIVAAKPDIEGLSISVRQHMLAELHLGSQDDILNFRLSDNIIEQMNAIARLSRAIAKSTLRLNEATVRT